MEIFELKKIATQVRRDVIRMISNANSGHPGGALGCADFLVVLFFKHLRIDPEKFTMSGDNEDIFILSNGHVCAALYSVLARRGYFPLSELSTFRKLNSRLQGHPSVHTGLPGIRISTGSLGQGLSFGIGMAIGKKLKNDPYLVYVLLGDGEIQEGQVWEAIAFASAHKIDNLIAIVDNNDLQIDGSIYNVFPFNIKEKFEAFGWITLSMNGHDFNDMLNTLNDAVSLSNKNKPIAIIMKTVLGMGVDFMMNNHKWHGTPPNQEQTRLALNQLPETLYDF